MGNLLDLFVFKYNRTDFHELNLDWIISDVKTLAETLNNFVALNSIKFADPIQWNISKQYEAITIVVDPATGTAYLSSQPVPSGVPLSNTDYWSVIFDLDIAQANNNITLRDDGNNVLSTFTSDVDDWLLWNGTLYKVTQVIGLSQAYVPGYNIERYTVEEFISDAVDALNTLIGNLQDLETTDKSSIVNAINSITSSLYVDVRKYGAVLDGITDDTAAFTAALADGSVMLPAGIDVKINNLYVPDFRTIDFNGSFVYTDNYAIRCEATNEHGYVRGITIQNAHFKTPNIANSNDHTFGGVYLDGAIKARIINCEVANCYDGTDLAYIRNSFNVSVDNCYCGTGNAAQTNNSSFVTYYCGDAIISGSDNITNCNITNSLAQRIEHGIYIDAANGLFDSNIMENVGFSYVDSCIETVGTSTRVRNTNVNVLRCEFCGIGIKNTGYMSVDNCYFTRMSTACIVNSGTMVVSGNVTAINPNDYAIIPLYSNTGNLNTVDTYPEFLSRVNVVNSGIYNKPVIPGANASAFIDNVYYTLPLTTLTGTTPSTNGSVLIPYTGDYDRDNTLVLSCRIYRSNGTWVEAQNNITSSGILVIVPADSTLYDRGIEIVIIKKY